MNPKPRNETRFLIIALVAAFGILGGSGFWRWQTQQNEWLRHAQEMQREAQRQAAHRAAAKRFALYQQYLAQQEARRVAEIGVRTALIEAAKSVNVPMVRQLLREGYDPNYSEDEEYTKTALDALISEGHYAIPSYDEKKPRQSEQRYRQFEKDLGTIVRLLAQYGATINPKKTEKHRLSPLMNALIGGREGPRLFPLIRALLQAGADPNEKFGDAKDQYDGVGTPLGNVARDWYRDDEDETRQIINELLRYGARLEGRDLWGRTALLQILGSDSEEGETALLLLKRGAKVNVRDRYKRTPLHALFGATAENVHNSVGVDLTLLKALLRRGANPSALDINKRTPLHLAIENLKMLSGDQKEVKKCLAAIKLLLRYGADTNARDKDGQTPLLRLMLGFDNDAPRYARLIGARLLFNYGADANLRDKKGQTPLLVLLKQASDGKSWDYTVALQNMARLLLQNGANAKVGTPDGKRFLQWVPSNQKPLRDLLKQWGAR